MSPYNQNASAVLAARLPDQEPTREPINIGVLIGSLAISKGGPPVGMRSLSRRLHHPGNVSIEVFSLQEADGLSTTQGWPDVPLTLTQVHGPRVFGYSPTLPRLLEDGAFDLLHVHGLWMYQSVAALNWAKRSGAPYIVSPHGMLDPWALQHSRWKKRIAEGLFETAHLERASCLHALCQKELEAIRAYGLRNPVCMIPNGVEPAVSPLPSPRWRTGLPSDAKVLLFLGRLHPKKGLRNLLFAWQKALRLGAPGAENWHLVIAGAGADDYVRELSEFVNRLSLEERVHLIGPQYGDDKHATLQAADAFILPSFSEGQPLAVLEAWAYSLPALITPGCNLPEGLERGAALHIGTDVDSIAQGLVGLFASSPDELQRIGQAGVSLAADTFNWDHIAEKFEEVYRWLLGQGDRPDCIDLCENA